MPTSSNQQSAFHRYVIHGRVMIIPLLAALLLKCPGAEAFTNRAFRDSSFSISRKLFLSPRTLPYLLPSGHALSPRRHTFAALQVASPWGKRPSLSMTVDANKSRGKRSILSMTDDDKSTDRRSADERLKRGGGKRVLTLVEGEIISSVSLSSEDETKLRQKHDLADDEPIIWRVLLHNDEVHNFRYVAQCIVKVIGWHTRAQAYEIVVEAHGSGQATVAKAWKSMAEKYCVGLQRQGLTVSIAPDDDFEKKDATRGSKKKGKKG